MNASTPSHATLETLKIGALARGIRVSTVAMQRLGGPARLTIHEYATTGGLTLELADGVYINAPFDEWFCADADLTLDYRGGGFVLNGQDMQVDVVQVLPLPGYLDMADQLGRAVRDTVMSHVDRLRISPIVGCAYDCQFCDLALARYQRRPVEQLVAAMTIARQDRTLPVRHALVSGGSPGPRRLDQDYLLDAALAILRAANEPPEGSSPLPVDVMASARPDGIAFIDILVDAGVAGFAFNMELYSSGASRQYIPRKHERSRPYLETMIRHAVARLGAGTGRVRSLIVVGLEPADQVLAGVRWLASLGCDPVLSPFRPAVGTPLQRTLPPDRDQLRELLNGAREIVAEFGVNLGPECVQCQHNTLTFPWDR